MTVAGPTFDLVVAANRLPVERVVDARGKGTVAAQSRRSGDSVGV